MENWDVPEIGGVSGRAILGAQLEACEQLLVVMCVSCEALMPTLCLMVPGPLGARCHEAMFPPVGWIEFDHASCPLTFELRFRVKA